MTIFPLCLCPDFLLFVRIPVILDMGPTLIQFDFIFTWLYLQRPYFQIRSYSQVLGGHEFGGNIIQSIVTTQGLVHRFMTLLGLSFLLLLWYLIHIFLAIFLSFLKKIWLAYPAEKDLSYIILVITQQTGSVCGARICLTPLTLHPPPVHCNLSGKIREQLWVMDVFLNL